MPEVVVKYNNPIALKVLKDLAKYFDFIVTSPKKDSNKKEIQIKGVSIIPADHTINISDLEEIFSDKNIHSSILRTKAWQRKK